MKELGLVAHPRKRSSVVVRLSQPHNGISTATTIAAAMNANATAPRCSSLVMSAHAPIATAG
jgi:hypothetical protein